MGITNEIGIGIGVRKGALLNLQPETKAYITGLTTPLSGNQVLKIDKLVKSLKISLGGITLLSEAFNYIHISAGQYLGDSLKNLVKDAHHYTLHGTTLPTHIPFEGIKCDGVSGYINGHYRPTTDRMASTVNSQAIGMYVRQLATTSASYNGILKSTTDAFYLGFPTSASLAYTYAVGGARIIPSAQLKPKFLIASRTAANLTILYSNGAEVSRSTNTPTDAFTSDYYIGVIDGGTGVPNSDWFNNQVTSIEFNSRGLTGLEVYNITRDFEAYMDSNDKGIIPDQRLTILGDSIAVAVQWPQLMPATKYDITDRAVGGSSILANLDGQVSLASVDVADIIIVAMGTNDDNAGNMTTLQAKIESNIIALKASNPQAILYYMNVLPRWTATNGVTEVAKGNIRNAITAACVAQNIICWDTYTTPWITAADTTEGLHPTYAGNVKIKDQILARI